MIAAMIRKSKSGAAAISLMVCGILVLFCASLLNALPLRQYTIAAQQDKTVIVYAGADQGLVPGQKLQVWHNAAPAGIIQVYEVYSTTSRCRTIQPPDLTVEPYKDFASPATEQDLAILAVSTPAPEEQASTPTGPNTLDDLLKLNMGEEILLLGAGAENIVLAAKHSQPMEEAPSSVWVLTREDIQALPAATIPELFYYIPGFDVLMLSDGNTEVSARGFNQGLANKLLVMLDGRVVYKDYYGAVLWKEIPVLLSDVERIEVIRGPGSALYGENAFLGVINIITRKPGTEEKTTMGAAMGPSGTTQITGYYEPGGDRIRTKIALGFDNFQRFDFQSGPENPLGARAEGSESIIRTRTGKAYIQASAPLNGSGTLTFDSGGSNTTVKLYSQSGNPFNEDHSQRFVALGYDNGLQNGNISARVSMDRFDAEVDEPADQAVLGLNDSKLLTENRMDFNLQYGTSLSRDHLLITGLDAKITKVESSLLSNRDHTGRAAGIYLQDEWKINDSTTLTLGVRRDSGTLLGSEISPRISLVHRLNNKDIVRGSISTAFRSPTFYDAYYSQEKKGLIPVSLLPPDLAELLAGQANIEYRFAIYGNPDLESEKIQALEAGWERERGATRLSLTIFHNDLENLILPTKISDLAYDPLSGILRGSATFSNTAKAISKGFEAALRHNFSPKTLGFLIFSHEEVYRKDSGEYLPYSPRFKLSGALVREFNSRWRVSLLMRYRSKQYVTRSINEPGYRVGAITIFSLKIFHILTPWGMKISLSVDDIFNKDYYDSPWYAPLGRTFWVGVENDF